MPSWPSADDRPPYAPASRSRLCSGRRLRRALFLCLAATPSVFAQQKPAPKPASVHRVNEFKLAGIRPGQDTLSRARSLYRQPNDQEHSRDSQLSWQDPCNHQRLTMDYDAHKTVQVIRVAWWADSEPTTCSPAPAPTTWVTGHGLKIYDSNQKLSQLYGPPDSKSPSTRDGQPLELWYYAFDWAGPDVPQVMEVLCTREQDGKPGHVIEITLAAPSL